MQPLFLRAGITLSDDLPFLHGDALYNHLLGRMNVGEGGAPVEHFMGSRKLVCSPENPTILLITSLLNFAWMKSIANNTSIIFLGTFLCDIVVLPTFLPLQEWLPNTSQETLAFTGEGLWTAGTQTYYSEPEFFQIDYNNHRARKRPSLKQSPYLVKYRFFFK